MYHPALRYVCRIYLLQIQKRKKKGNKGGREEREGERESGREGGEQPIRDRGNSPKSHPVPSTVGATTLLFGVYDLMHIFVILLHSFISINNIWWAYVYLFNVARTGSYCISSLSLFFLSQHISNHSSMLMQINWGYSFPLLHEIPLDF